MNKKRKILNDCILIFSLLALSLLILLIYHSTRRAGDAVRVYLGGEMLCELPLDRDTTLPVGDGNRIRIEGGEVFMEEADCPDGLCVRQGRASFVGERIICLPNGVIIEIVGDGDGLI